MTADRLQEILRRLTSRHPRWNKGCYPRHERECKKLASHEAAYLGSPGTLQHEKIPCEKPDCQRHPAVQGDFIVKPKPSTEDQVSARAAGVSRQEKPSHQRIAPKCQQEHRQADQLKPVARSGRS